MDERGGGRQFSRHGHNAGHSNDKGADSPFSESYSFLFDCHSSSSEATDDGIDGKIDGAGNYQAGSNLPKHEDTSAIGDMLVGVLNRFARHCADAEDRLEKLRRQNAAQSAEMQELRERVKKLEALLPPTPRLASPPYHDRGPRAPPSTRQMRPPQQSEAPVEAAIIEDGRVVRMRAGERPRELWTACRTGPVSHERAELDRAGLERPYAPAKAPPTPRLRRPPSPKPLPTKNATFPPMDAPPVPTRSITSPDVCYTRHMLRDRKTGFEPREDDVRWVTRAHEIQPLAV